jgi:hypothetical protein
MRVYKGASIKQNILDVYISELRTNIKNNSNRSGCFSLCNCAKLLDYVDNNRYEITKARRRTMYDIDKMLYYVECELKTSSIAYLINDIDKRGCDYHLDHKYPISKGYLNGVLPSIIGGVDNLQIIHRRDNFLKSDKVFNEFDVLAIDINTLTKD